MEKIKKISACQEKGNAMDFMGCFKPKSTSNEIWREGNFLPYIMFIKINIFKELRSKTWFIVKRTQLKSAKQKRFPFNFMIQDFQHTNMRRVAHLTQIFNTNGGYRG